MKSHILKTGQVKSRKSGNKGNYEIEKYQGNHELEAIKEE